MTAPPPEDDDILVTVRAHDPPGPRPFATYVQIYKWNSATETHDIHLPIEGGGSEVFVLPGEVDHMLIEPHDGHDRVDLSGVTAANGYSFVDQWLDGTPQNPHGDTVLWFSSHASRAVTVHGGEGRDTIIGSEFGDCVKGGEFGIFEEGPNGHDSILAGAGNDFLEGEGGNDTIHGGAGHDFIYGFVVNQDEHSLDGADSLHGDDGDDTLIGQHGNDRLFGDMGDDSLRGGGGNDRLQGDAGEDQLFGEAGDDELYGRGGDDRLIGGADSDRYYFDGLDGPESTAVGDLVVESSYGGAADELNFTNAYGGPVTLDLTDAALQMLNGSLWLTLRNSLTGNGMADIERVIGTSGADHVIGNDLDNFIDVAAGDDTVFAGEGDDSILGGDGHDSIFAGAGGDTVFGGAGHDCIHGEAGDDDLHGNDGWDALFGGPGDDTLRGGAGVDLGAGGADGPRGDLRGGIEQSFPDGDQLQAFPIDLVASSDSGVSDTDDLTNHARPVFMGVAVCGLFARLYMMPVAGGPTTLIATKSLGSPGEFTIQPDADIPDGTYKFTITISADALDPAESLHSPPLIVTIDTAGPRVAGVRIQREDRTNPVEAEYLIPIGSGAQIQTVPVGSADQVAIIFDEDVVDPLLIDLTLASNSPTGPSYGFVGAPSYNAGAQTAAWTLTTPFNIDGVLLTLSDGVLDLAGNALDGDWVNPLRYDETGTAVSTFPSGDSAAGGDFVFHFTMLPGDTDRNNQIDLVDLNAVRNNFGAVNATWAIGDTNGDGVVELVDLNQVRNNFGKDLQCWDGPCAPLAPLVAGGGSMLVNSTSTASSPATVTPVGEERLRAALYDEYHRHTVDPSSTSPYSDLLGWDALGDDAWWAELLGTAVQA